MRFSSAGIALGVVAATLSGVAQADVIEIGPGGDIVAVSGPVRAFEIDGELVRAPIAAPPVAHPNLAAISAYLDAAGERTKVSPALLEAVAWAESRFRIDARSPKGALGPMQLMPGTAAELGVDPLDPKQNVDGGALYLRELLATFDGDLERALAAYNAGPNAVRRHGGVPPYPETRAYVAAVLGYLADQAVAAPGAKP